MIVDVTVIVPVATVHVGCVTVAAGVVGAAGCAITTTEVPELTHPPADFIVTVYVLGCTPKNIVLD